jgi:hypothetical protein
MAEIKTCVFLSQRGHSDSPPGGPAEAVYEKIILPTMDRFPDFRMNPRGYFHDGNWLAERLVDEIHSADLVIADLTDLSHMGYYQLGVRQPDLPVVFIAEEGYEVHQAALFGMVYYELDDPDSIEMLTLAIRSTLDQHRSSSGSYPRIPLKATPKGQPSRQWAWHSHTGRAKTHT